MSTSVLDDRRSGTFTASSGATWRCFTDAVMGGVSTGWMSVETIDGRAALVLHGQVSLAHNGGFVQMALDLPAPPAAGVHGIEFDVHGNGRRYGLHLRTADMTAPWQAWRARFDAPPRWQTLRLPWSGFEPHRTPGALEPVRIRRIGLLAIGEPGEVALNLGRIAFW